VLQLVHLQLPKQHFRRSPFEQVDDLPGGVRFESLHHVGQVGGCGDEMKVILEDDVTEEFEFTLALQESPRIVDDVGRLAAREDREPADDRACHEVRGLRFVDAVAGARHR
jgi:hypothetical protein